MAVMFDNNSSKYKRYSGYTSKKKKKKQNPLVFKSTTTDTSSSSSDSGVDSLTQQTVNYKTRLEAINADGKDTRNPIEKLLNLPEDQNFLFDVGEILGRPFNAVKGGIQEAQEGGDFGEGFVSGISGEKTYYAGDILRNAGVSDEALFTNPLNGEDVSAADILGLGLDIFADPMDYIPGGIVAKGVNVASKGRQLNKAKKAVSKATDALNTVKAADNALDTVSDAQRAYNSVRLARATDNLANAQAAENAARSALEAVKAAPSPKMSLTDLAVSGVVGGVKGTARFGDNLLTKGLEKFDDRTLRQMVKRGESAKDIKNIKGMADSYKGIKNTVRRTADYNRSIPSGLVNEVNRSDNIAEAPGIIAAGRIRNMKGEIDDYVKRGTASKGSNFTFKDSDDVETAIQEVYSKLNKKEATNAYSFFSKAANSSARSATLTGTYKNLQRVADKINNSTVNGKRMGDLIDLTVTKSGKGNEAVLKLAGVKGKGRTDLNSVVNNPDLSNYLKNINIGTPTKIKNAKSAKEFNANVNRYMKAYNEDKEFRQLYDDSIQIMKDYVDDLYKRTGEKMDFNEIIGNRGYLRKALNEELPYRRNKVFGPAEYGDLSAGKANIIRSEHNNEIVDKLSKRLKSKKSVLSEDGQALVDEYLGSGKSVDDLMEELKSKDMTITGAKQQRIGDQLKAAQAELKERNRLSSAIDAIRTNRISDSEIETLKNSLSEKGNKVLNRAIRTKNKGVNLNKLAKDKDNALRNYRDFAGADTMNKIRKTGNVKIANQYMTTLSKYNNSIKNANNVEKRIVQASEKGEDVTKLTKQLDKYYNQAAKYSNSLQVKKTRLDNSISSDVTKSMRRAIDNTSDLTKARAGITSKIEKNDAQLEAIRNANSKIQSDLESKINRLTIEFENLKPDLPANIAKDRQTLKEIGDLQRQIDYLTSNEGKELFSTSFFDGLGDFIKYSENDTKDVLGYSKVLLENGLNDTNLVKFISRDGATRPIAGGVRMSKQEVNNMLNYIDIHKNLVSDDIAKNLDLFKNKLKESDGIYIDKTAHELLKRNEFVKDNANELVKFYNGVNDIFKTVSTTTLGYHFRNITGNATNMVLSGIPAHKLLGEFRTANRVLNSDYMWRLFTDGAKTATEKADLKLLNQFIDNGFLGQGKEIRDLQSLIDRFNTGNKNVSGLRKAFNKVFDVNIRANEFIDARSRMMVLDYANKNPKYMARIGAKTPGDAVRYTVLDPTNLSPWEKRWGKKIIPFYTFTKQNLLFQAKNIVKNPVKYKRLLTTLNSAYGALDEYQYRDYQRDSMQVPVYTDEEGNTLVVKTNLPAADLGEWVENPLQKLVSSTTPLIRTPFEAVTGVDTFTGNESNKSGLDYLAGLLGLSNVTRIPGRLSNLSTDNTTTENVANILGSINTYNDAEKIANSNAYEEYLEYQEYIDELKSQGINVPTITELREQGVDVDAIRDRISGDNSLLRSLKKKREELQKSLGY